MKNVRVLCVFSFFLLVFQFINLCILLKFSTDTVVIFLEKKLAKQMLEWARKKVSLKEFFWYLPTMQKMEQMINILSMLCKGEECHVIGSC